VFLLEEVVVGRWNAKEEPIDRTISKLISKIYLISAMHNKVDVAG
jgi:hypothetical protein